MTYISIMGELEAAEVIMGTMMIDGKNNYVNKKRNDAIKEIRHVLSDISDAMFDIITGL